MHYTRCSARSHHDSGADHECGAGRRAWRRLCRLPGPRRRRRGRPRRLPSSPKRSGTGPRMPLELQSGQMRIVLGGGERNPSAHVHDPHGNAPLRRTLRPGSRLAPAKQSDPNLDASRADSKSSSPPDRRRQPNRRQPDLSCGDKQWWWALPGSNRRPARCKRAALPTELNAPFMLDARTLGDRRRRHETAHSPTDRALAQEVLRRCDHGHRTRRQIPAGWQVQRTSRAKASSSPRVAATTGRRRNAWRTTSSWSSRSPTEAPTSRHTWSAPR